MTATTEFFWPAGIQRPPFRHGLITSNIVSNIVNYSAILLTLLQAILNQVLPPSFSVSTSVVFLTGKTARQPYLAALLRPRAYGPHWRHGRSHSHGNPRERFAVVAIELVCGAFPLFGLVSPSFGQGSPAVTQRQMIKIVGLSWR